MSAIIADDKLYEIDFINFNKSYLSKIKLSNIITGDVTGFLTNNKCDSNNDINNLNLSLADVKILAPIPRPQRNVFCVGKNYLDHILEISKAGISKQEQKSNYPIIFSKVPDAVIGIGDDILLDTEVTSQLDYEVELGIVIGKAGKNIKPKNALDYVAGVTIINDISARDIQMRHKQWLLGKSQDTSCPVGPWLVRIAELEKMGKSITNLQITTRVNGELRQNSSTKQMIHTIPEIISTISQGITLKVGDLIATGTPEGVGIGMRPQKFLQDGDVVEMYLEGVGYLTNHVKQIK